MRTSNWPGGVDYGHSNFTGRIPRKSKYDGVGGWAKDSSTPPWGWAISIVIGLALFGALLLGPAVAARIIGL